MRLGIDSQKLPEFVKRGPLASLDLVKELGLAGLFFPTVLDMSPTLDKGALRDIREKADELGLYLESGVGKINPYCSAEAPVRWRPPQEAHPPLDWRSLPHWKRAARS